MTRPYLFRFFSIVVCLLLGFNSLSSLAQNRDEPTITTQIRYRSGAEVTIAYESSYWNGSRQNPSPESLLNNYSEQMGMLENNVKLQIGPTILEPAIYWFGMVPLADDTWELVIKTEAGEDVSRLPIVMRVESNLVDYLSIVLRPGRTEQDFIMTLLFGTRSTSLRWTITGMPVKQTSTSTDPNEHLRNDLPQGSNLIQTHSEPASDVSINYQATIPDLGSSPAAATNQIKNTTHTSPTGLHNRASGFNINAMTKTTPTIKSRAGSGSFRRLMEIYEKEQ